MNVARVAGWLYIAASVLVIAAGSIRAGVIVPEPAATIEHIRASEALFRVGLTAELLSSWLFLFTAIALFVLFSDVDKGVGAFMVILVTVATATWSVALADQLTLLSVATEPVYGASLGAEGSQALVAMLAQGRRSAMFLNEFVAGAWLLPLGSLVMRAASFPSWLGWLLIAGGVSWLTMAFIHLLAPGLAAFASYLTLGSIGEVVLMVWLVARGPNGERRGPGRPPRPTGAT